MRAVSVYLMRSSAPVVLIVALQLSCDRGRSRPESSVPPSRSHDREPSFPPPSPLADPYGAIEPCDSVWMRKPPAISARPLRLVAIGVRPLDLDGNRLTVEASYACGCGQHSFRLCFDDRPPMAASAVLVKLLDWTSNKCEGACRAGLSFDVSPLAPRRHLATSLDRQVSLHFLSGQKFDYQQELHP
jgi:hypothetical protein